MPTRGKEPNLLVDTSVAVALVVADHENHEATHQAIGARRLGLAGHAAFETFSVLTRLPPPARRSPAVVAQLLAENFPASRFLSASSAQQLLVDLAPTGVAGGSVYDALVAATAREHGLVLATSDQRALDTYRALKIQIQFVPDR